MTLAPTATTTRRALRRVVCLFAVVAGLLTALAPGAAATLPRSDVQSQQWWITRLALRDVWKITEGQGVTVAVADGGVDANFGDLKGAVVPGFGVGVAGTAGRDNDPAYHGTRMADTIAGRGTGFGLLGIAPKATIMPVELTFGDAVNGAADTTTMLNKLSAMADPPDVVSMSYGSSGACTADLQDAVRTATSKGMILVASAGNTPSEYSNPANCVGVIAVGAFGNDLQAWSNSARQPYVALAAPGVKMIGYSTTAPSGYGYATGTSDSAAIVAGTFALVRQKFPKLSSRDVVTRVLYTARQFGGTQGTRNSTWGYGAARPQHALTDPVPASAPNPIYDALAKLGTPSSTPTAPSTGASSPPAGSSAAGSSTAPPLADSGAETGDSSSSTGLIIGIVVAALVVVLVIVLLVVRGRRRTPTGPGGPYGPGPSGPPPPGWG